MQQKGIQNSRRGGFVVALAWGVVALLEITPDPLTKLAKFVSKAISFTSTYPVMIRGVAEDVEDGTSIALVTVSSAASAAPATTDSNGVFSLTIVSYKEGDMVVLRARKAGYETEAMNVVPSLSSDITFTMSKTGPGRRSSDVR